MRWDGVIPPDSVIPGLVSHVDLAPTLADAAGTTMPGEVDGVSLLPMLTDAQAAVHDVALFEHVRFRAGDPPSYCGIHTATDRVYVRYASGEEEFYNLRKDDAQLRNRAGGGSARLADARERADLVCPFGEIPGFRLDPG